MKKVSFSDFQAELIRIIFLVEKISMNDKQDFLGGGINDRLVTYSPLMLLEFTDEELDYLKLRLNTISSQRKSFIAKFRKVPLSKIEKTIKELINILT